MDLAEAVTAPVAEPEVTAPAGVVFRSRFNLGEILRLYEIGRDLLLKKHHERWRDTFVLGISTGGVLAAEGADGQIGLISVFWRTDNANVDVAHRLPEPVENGNFVYVCWLWSELGAAGVLGVVRHIEQTFPDARFLAHHDSRSKSKQRRSERERQRGRQQLITVPLRAAKEPRNGTGFIRQ